MKAYYEHAGIVIYHGDCRDVLPQLERPACILTDPPYGVGLAYGSHDDTPRSYMAWIGRVFELMHSSSEILCLTPGIRNLWLYPPADWVLCWAKPGSTRRSDLGGFNEWEPILLYGKRRIYNDFRYLPDCVNHGNGFGHPCPKPIKLYSWLVEQLTEEGQAIVDPFCGSGTTLIAAKNLRRSAIGIEIEEKYCEIAAKRLSQEVLDFGQVLA